MKQALSTNYSGHYIRTLQIFAKIITFCVSITFCDTLWVSEAVVISLQYSGKAIRKTKLLQRRQMKRFAHGRFATRGHNWNSLKIMRSNLEKSLPSYELEDR